jgi:SAM-dependent methyltransferase
MREWNAETYQRVSEPHVQWGMRVLDRLPLAGDELVLDVGCGTGRLTEKLLERLPNGRALAVDQSVNMLDAGRRYLTPRFRAQIHFVLADATALPIAGHAHALFSTATFHWVLDIVTSVEPSPVIQPDAAAYREFVANVICRPFLARLPDETLRDRFMDAVTTQAAADRPAFELDYWRLNMEARRPR